jgi:hypothetical protein
MLRILIVLFWLGLLVGTLLAHDIVADWAVTLAGLHFLARWWRGRAEMSRVARAAAQPATGIARPAGADQPSPAGPAPGVRPHSRWTLDRLHAAERRWR